MGIAYGRVERFHDDQLVVALPDLDVVTKALDRLGVHPGRIDHNAALGLALVADLSNIDGAVRTLQQDADIRPELARFKEEREGSRPHAIADLDLLVKGIKIQFARDYPGWEVPIGKNHRPSPVHGDPHIFADGHPEPAKAALSPRQGAAGRGVRVGLLDTRLFPGEWLSGSYLARPGDLLDPGQGTYTIFDGHCAFVGSCILQQAPAAEIHVRHVLDSHGDGSAWHAAVTMAEIAQIGVDVVNLSLGEFFTDDYTAPMVFETAVRRFSSETVVVAAAGNNGNPHELTSEMLRNGIKPNTASYPAALPDVVGVGALDQNGKLAAFTPYPAPWIALLAPGVGLTGAYVQGNVLIQDQDEDGKVQDRPVAFNGTATWEGCSFAAGVVSGAIAARTVPGRRTARQALEELLDPDPGKPGSGILPNRLDS